nr:MAG TPA: hypothetical protein [Caudoviricetes sp.]DAH85978.1 MAG TPA: hypothetical protein [Caudoviricetes sp.]
MGNAPEVSTGREGKRIRSVRFRRKLYSIKKARAAAAAQETPSTTR